MRIPQGGPSLDRVRGCGPLVRIAGLLVCGLSTACQGLPGTIPTSGITEEAAADAAAGNAAGGDRSAAQPAGHDIDPAALMGKDPAGVTRLLGKPDLERVEEPALIWQYRGHDCVVDLFFYPEASGDPAAGKAVVYLEARDRDVGQIAARGCLNRLAAGRQKAGL